MADRPTASTVTDDQLEQLYAELDDAERRATASEEQRTTYREAWHSAKQRARKQHTRAERAENELETARRAILRLLRTTANVGETEDQHVDRVGPDEVRGLLDAVADALPVDPAEERDVVWSHYRLTHRVLNRRLAKETARAERVEQQLDQVRALVRDLADPDPCYYDHHGYCQAHGWMATEPACPHARAALDGAQQPGPEPARQDGHTGACAATTAPGDPEPTEHPNGPHTRTHDH